MVEIVHQRETAVWDIVMLIVQQLSLGGPYCVHELSLQVHMDLASFHVLPGKSPVLFDIRRKDTHILHTIKIKNMSMCRGAGSVGPWAYLEGGGGAGAAAPPPNRPRNFSSV